MSQIDSDIQELFSNLRYNSKKTIVYAIASGLESHSPEEIGKYLISNIENTGSISTKLIRYNLVINHIHSEGRKQSVVKKSQYEELEKILKDKRQSIFKPQ